MGITEGKRSPGINKSRWEDNMKMVLKEIRWEVVELIDLIQDKD
jgi:hypothetical protein